MSEPRVESVPLVSSELCPATASTGMWRQNGIAVVVRGVAKKRLTCRIWLTCRQEAAEMRACGARTMPTVTRAYVGLVTVCRNSTEAVPGSKG